MESSEPRALLFDWDNTLVDTWPAIHDATNTTLVAMGQRPWTYEETRARVRRSMREAFPDLFGERWREAGDIFLARFREIHLGLLVAAEGAGELLESLNGRGTYLGVVSNKTGRLLREEADHLGWSGHFGRLIGATDAPRDKPSREAVDLALEGSGIAAGPDVWLVGDTDIDMQCAHRAGCVAVLVRHEPPDGDEFGEFAPAFHFPDCQALCSHLRNL